MFESKNTYTLKQILINAIWFKICWLACVNYGNTAAIIALPLTILIHTYIISINIRQWGFVILVTILGLVFDTLFGITGLLIFPENATTPPFWLITVWFIFATLLLISLPRIISSKILFIPLAGIGGMFSYTAGSVLSGIELGHKLEIMLPIFLLGWMIAGFFLHTIYRQMFLKMENSHV